MKITPDLFEAFLNCPTKCWLKAADEPTPSSTYGEWVLAHNESFRLFATQRFLSVHPKGHCVLSPTAEEVKDSQWRLATDLVVKAEWNSCSLESRIDVVERVQSEGRGRPTQFIPIRFIFTNKVSKNQKLLLAFDAFMLSETIGRKISFGDWCMPMKHRSI